MKERISKFEKKRKTNKNRMNLKRRITQVRRETFVTTGMIKEICISISNKKTTNSLQKNKENRKTTNRIEGRMTHRHYLLKASFIFLFFVRKLAIFERIVLGMEKVRMKIFSSRYEIFARCYTYTRALIQFLVLEI
jgi:hypothetical protein